MKRAVFLCIATASLLLIGLPSAPLHAESQSNAKSATPSVVTAGAGSYADGPVTGTGGGGGGGTDQGDADGLSGIKNRPIGGTGVSGPDKPIMLHLWWRFMILWVR
jgi:hypothetical protein